MAIQQRKTKSGVSNRRGVAIENAYTLIKHLIYYNLLAPGQKIIYGDISRRLNTSTTPVMQALNRLEASGFVTYVPNQGYFVGEITMDETLELFEAREAMETCLIPRIIEKITRHDIEQIKQVFRQYGGDAVGGLNRKLIMVDAKFHLRLAKYADNRVIFNILQDVFEKLYLKYRPEYLNPMEVREVTSERRRILGALGRGDAQTVVETNHKHIAASLERITSALRQREEIGLYPFSGAPRTGRNKAI
ncbi:GntR family transcriptional regulator [Desulfoferula mesophila]|uniref:GntR family transcriptional regulator n=1 Tax=Desulfoferula mesophila TaxID=3058419 RepID=A0AAU9EE19_9BACT|nr:GntR family transcriptional regulator [Desulfoferula mesophilus]